MTQRMHSRTFFRNHKERRERQLRKLSNMRAAKARKRQALVDAGLLEREPKMERAYRFEIGFRDTFTGDIGWKPLKSSRNAHLTAGLILKYCL